MGGRICFNLFQKKKNGPILCFFFFFSGGPLPLMDGAALYLQSKDQPTQADMVRKLEAIGCRIGASLVERVSRDTHRFKNELDAMVFICKPFWMQAFSKQMDNLKTNHQVMWGWV